MDNRRQERVAQLLQETMSAIFQRESSRFIEPSVLVTITKVRVSPDLSTARFFLSIFNTKEPEKVMASFEEHKSEWRHFLGNEMRHHLRNIPELIFERDDTLDYVERMDEIFKKIHEADKDKLKSDKEAED